jgi:hypothetical protein
MMARISLAVMFGLLVSTSLCAVAIVQEEEEKQETEAVWFDMDNCAICKNMASMRHDMHKIEWESHMLDDGMITVAKVPDDMKAAMEKAEASIQQTVAKLEQGEQLELCGYCQNYGKLMEMGAKFKEIKTMGVSISVVTSRDKEVVKEIQAMGKKAKIEHDKMIAKIKSPAGEEK